MPNQRKAGTVAVLIRMQQADKDRLEQAAKAAGTSITDLCRQAIFERVELIEKLSSKK